MKSDLSPEDILTRSDKVKKLQFPQSDANRVIVVCNQEGVGFKFNCYKAEFLQSYVDKLTFDATVKSAHKICEAVWKIRKAQERGVSDGSAYFQFISLLLSLISFIMLTSVVYYTQDQFWLYFAIVLNYVAGCNTLYVAFRTLFVKPKFIDLDSEIMKNLKEFLDRENTINYNPKGLHWELQPNYYWMELHIRK